MTALRVLKLVSLLVLVLGSTAQAGDLHAVHSVAVVSALGDVMVVQRRGWMVTGNRLDRLAVNAWGLDDHIEKAVSARVANRFQLHAPPPMSPTLDNCVGIRDCAPLLPRSAEFDAYIVVTKAVCYCGGHDSTGIGIFRGPGIFGKVNAGVHVIYDLAVVDARTGEVLASQSGEMPEMVLGVEHAWPVASLDASDWPDAPDMLPEPVTTEIRQSVTSLIDGSLPYTAEQLGL